MYPKVWNIGATGFLKVRRSVEHSGDRVLNKLGEIGVIRTVDGGMYMGSRNILGLRP